MLLKLCLVLMIPTSDVYQEFPLESWLKIKMNKRGVEYLAVNKAGEKGKYGDLFKESNVVLRHLLTNIVLVNMDREIKDKKLALKAVEKNERFKNILNLMYKKEKVLPSVSLQNLCQASLKYFRPHYSKIPEGKDAFHRCIYPSLSEIPSDSMVLADALGYSTLVHMEKKDFKMLKQKWEMHVAKLFAEKKPKTKADYEQLLKLGRETFPFSKTTADAVRAEYLKLQKWLPFELQEGNP